GMPNGALSSLAGSVDGHHEVAVADLILAQERVGETVERLVREREPDVVGLSVMTFQRKTAFKIVERVRALRPAARIVAGGYDPSLDSEAYAGHPDFVVRGGGELTFPDLLPPPETGGPHPAIPGPPTPPSARPPPHPHPTAPSAGSAPRRSACRGARPGCWRAIRSWAGRWT